MKFRVQQGLVRLKYGTDNRVYKMDVIHFLLYTSGPVSLKERLLYTLDKLFVKQAKSFLLLLDLDPFILQCSLHNIKYIKFTSP